MDLPALLLAIHGFFEGLGVDEIRRRGAADDKPLRMVKTLLHELCKRKVLWSFKLLRLPGLATLLVPLGHTRRISVFSLASR